MFETFFLAGFEGATGYNMHGEWFDQVSATAHDVQIDADYRRLTNIGIRAVREVVRWPLVDAGRGRYDFSSLEPVLEAARKYGMDVIFDLFHFGYPDGLDVFGPDFPRRFADYCGAAARFVSAETDGVCYFTPVNEPSYFAWAAGEVGLFAPHQRGRGWELKVALAAAGVQGIEAIRDVCGYSRIINVDPVCRVVPPENRPDLQEEADYFNDNIVFQSLDMLSGRLLPELGGSAAHLDVVGVNYYWTNQWELHRPGSALSPEDPRCWPLRRIVGAVYARYGHDILITETGHVDEQRAEWIRQIARDTEILIADGVPLRGICMYPVIGMPEWHARETWTRMGLWDVVQSDGFLERIPCKPALQALREAQERMERVLELEPDQVEE